MPGPPGQQQHRSPLWFRHSYHQPNSLQVILTFYFSLVVSGSKYRLKGQQREMVFLPYRHIQDVDGFQIFCDFGRTLATFTVF
jgi:hypothetical protein